MAFEVYLISSTKTKKQYVGVTTKGYLNRFANHIWHSRKQRKSCRALYEAINKFGAESFSVELLYTANSRDEMHQMEIHFIKSLNTLSPDGYNLTEGGDAGIMSEETKQMMSDRLKGQPLSDKNKAGLIAAWKDPAIRHQRCLAIKAAMNRESVRQKTSERQKGKPKSDHHIKSIREAIASSVRCVEAGIDFEAMIDAVNWVRACGEYPKANHAKIIRATKRSDYTAYGFHWVRL